MESALLRVTCKELRELFGLPDGVTIDAAFQDYEDLKSDTVSFRLRGTGEHTVDGGQIKYMRLCDIAEHHIAAVREYLDRCISEGVTDIDRMKREEVPPIDNEMLELALQLAWGEKVKVIQH